MIIWLAYASRYKGGLERVRPSFSIAFSASAGIFTHLNISVQSFILQRLQKTIEEMFKQLWVENRLQLGQCVGTVEM